MKKRIAANVFGIGMVLSGAGGLTIILMFEPDYPRSPMAVGGVVGLVCGLIYILGLYVGRVDAEER